MGRLAPHLDVAPKGDRDFYGFFGYEGDVLFVADEIQIEINRFGDRNTHDCQLLDANGAVLSSDSAADCLLEYVLPNNDFYYIRVLSQRWCSFYGSCPYELKLQKTNKAPQAAPESYKVFSGETLTIGAPGVLDNDSDPDGDPLTAVLTSDALNGDLDLASNGSFSYKPDAGFTGNDRFYYAASDGSLQSEAVRVDIKVEYKNKAPVANPESYNVLSGETLTTSAPGVLGNDFDPEDDPLTAVLVSNVQHGALTLNKNGAFTYSPQAGYAGEDSFQYCASDGRDESNHAKVSITIANENNAPITNPDLYQMLTGQMLVIAAPGVLKNDVDLDGDPLTAVLSRDVLNGDLKLSSDGSFSYIPKPGFIGSDTFQYYAFDGRDPALVSTVTITVRPFTLYLPGIKAK